MSKKVWSPLGLDMGLY